jgi:hypothetical protein
MVRFFGFVYPPGGRNAPIQLLGAIVFIKKQKPPHRKFFKFVKGLE